MSESKHNKIGKIIRNSDSTKNETLTFFITLLNTRKEALKLTIAKIEIGFDKQYYRSLKRAYECEIEDLEELIALLI